MTVYEYFDNQATLNRQLAVASSSKRMEINFLSDAEKWERRARALSVDVASMDVDDVIMWRIIEAADRAMACEARGGV